MFSRIIRTGSFSRRTAVPSRFEDASVWCEYVDAAIRDHRPDVIVVNAARAAVAPFGPIIMGLEDVEKVLAAAPEATVIASHMDNVGHATVWREDIREFAAQHGVTKRLLIPEDGETCCL